MKPARLVIAALLLTGAAQAQSLWHFEDATAASGVDHAFAWQFGFSGEPDMMAGGAAAADVDADGDIDLLLLRGDAVAPVLLLNDGSGHFAAAANSGLPVLGGWPNGAAFADIDGDGDPDLLIGVVNSDTDLDGIPDLAPRVFANDGNGGFTEITAAAGLGAPGETWSAAFADIDGDGDLDLALGRWTRPADPGKGETGGHLWRNDGSGAFSDASTGSGVGAGFASASYSFTPNFADIDGDGDPDLLIAADFGSSRALANDGSGAFTDTAAPLDDENGMGAAVGDIDNDGDLDWFVSSIFDPDGAAEGNWGTTGNRLYANDGSGGFSDVSAAAGVRDGGWGWGACFADLDNDGWLDLFQVNGMVAPPATEFHADPSRLFINDGDGSFSERSGELGVVDHGQGRAVLCFDADRDGDIDLLVQNGPTPAQQPGMPRLFRNVGGNARPWLAVALRGCGANSHCIGARLTLEAGGMTQLREISAGSNYLSSNPPEAHFGLGDASWVQRLTVRWPGGAETVWNGLHPRRFVRLGPDQQPLFLNSFE